MASYAAIALPINSIGENKPLPDAIHDQPAHSTIQVVRYDRAGNLEYFRLGGTQGNQGETRGVYSQHMSTPRLKANHVHNQMGNALASLWHRLYVTDPNFSCAFAVLNKNDWSDKATHLNCQTFFCLDER
jgi:hypothetical protein